MKAILCRAWGDPDDLRLAETTRPSLQRRLYLSQECSRLWYNTRVLALPGQHRRTVAPQRRPLPWDRTKACNRSALVAASFMRSRPSLTVS